MNNDRNKNHFFKGAFLLTYASLLSKVLSALYRIPLQNLAGDVGFYTYQQIYPFLGMAMILALYGFPAAVSRFIASQKGGLSNQLKRKVLGHLCLFAGVIFIIIFVGAPWIATIMGDSKLVEGIRASAIPFLFVPFIAYLRGFFQGQGNMLPTAASQIAEQLVRVTLIIVVAFFVVFLNRSLYDIGVGTALASTFGAVVALIVLLIFHGREKDVSSVNDDLRQPFSQSLFTAIIGYGLAIAVNHMLLLLLQFVDALTLVPLLRQTGMSLIDAQAFKGVLDRAQPLAQLGIVTASSMALALIPSITKARLENDRKRSLTHMTSIWRFTLYLASGATVGLIVLLPEINTFLFKDDLGTVSLRIFMIAIVFSALSISTASILQGIGQIYRTAFFILIGLAIKFGANLLLVPFLGISGAALATVFATIVIFLINQSQLNRGTPKDEKIHIPWKGFILSILLMAGVVFIVNGLTRSWFYQFNRFGQLIYLLGLIAVGVITYLASLLKLSVFSKEEQEVLPFISHFLKDEQE